MSKEQKDYLVAIMEGSESIFSGYGTQDYTPSSAEAEHYSSFNNRFTTYADFLPSNIMNMPPMTGDAKYIATPHTIIWSNVVYPNGIPEGPYGTLFGSDAFGNDDEDQLFRDIIKRIPEILKDLFIKGRVNNGFALL